MRNIKKKSWIIFFFDRYCKYILYIWKKWEIYIVMVIGWCVVRFYWFMLGIGDDFLLFLGIYYNVLGLVFCIMIMISSNVYFVGLLNNVLVVSDFICWYLV